MITLKQKLIALVAVQVVLVMGILGYKQAILSTGQPILLETLPVDPRDFFRGDYVNLNFAISSLEQEDWLPPPNAEIHEPWTDAFQIGDIVFVRLRQAGRFWDVESFSQTRPETGVLYLRGRVSYIMPPFNRIIETPPEQVDHRFDNPTLEVEYGLENYFVQEGTGLALEEIQRDPEGRLIAEVVVDRSGKGVLRNLYPDK